ncbi:MAG: hypothetical protein K0Q43_4161 [Ramlibacter sp.]|jgi:hypothetical protein|nr:hypothetical protein [Ramlibacter sp.]
MPRVFPGLDTASYTRHALHGDDAIWLERNCYGDLWIELVHALRMEPRAMLAFTLGVDFEGDQWTFFKPPLDELRELYGIDVQEMSVWRPLIEHAVEQLGAGKIICTEADAFWLPDTAATDYRRQHTKTTIALADLDVEGERLGYFHNAGYFELSGEDFRRLFRIGVPADPAFMPLFAELVRIDRLARRSEVDLAACSLALLRKHFARRPASNPIERFGERLARDLPALQAAGLPTYHAWAFAGIRQAGSAFELAAAHLRWLAGFGRGGLLPAAASFEAIAQGNKALILKGARAVNSGRPLDAAPLVQEMAQAWDRGMASLGEVL